MYINLSIKKISTVSFSLNCQSTVDTLEFWFAATFCTINKWGTEKASVKEWRKKNKNLEFNLRI